MREETKSGLISCIGCGAKVPDVEGPIHKYLGSSAGCWKIFGDILAREYGDSSYMKAHQLTVDAYAVQHPGRKSPQTIQSVNLHLMSLSAALEHGVKYSFIPKVMNKKVKEYKGVFTWPSVPKFLGSLTVVDVAKARNAEEHERLARDWAKSAWRAWSEYHPKIESYMQSIDSYTK